MTTADLTALIKKHSVGFAAGLAALVFAGATYYRATATPGLLEELQAKTAESARVAANVRNSAQLPAQLADLTAASKEVQSRLVHASELANNLQYFYRLEADTGTKLLELRQNPLSAKSAGQKGTLIGVGFNVALQGEYFSVLDVFRRLETGGHYCRVTSVNLSSIGPERSSPVKMSLALELLGQP